MRSLALFFETPTGKYIKNFIIGVGAGIVLLGALFKLQHWEGANIMLSVGMFTEVFIFVLLGLLPPHKDYYWERYYPDLDKNPHVEAYKKGVKFVKPEGSGSDMDGSGSKLSPAAQFDKMLEEANINKPNLEKLSNSLQNFGKTVDEIKDNLKCGSSYQQLYKCNQRSCSGTDQIKEYLCRSNRNLKVFQRSF
ncbi:MAG: gliding motility protein GldL [Taibaiella sp.]|nr:gliding motility protein GldL [Taibaiella sp.]